MALVRDLIKRSVDVDIADKGGNTSLMRATELNLVDIVHYLTDKGADVDTANGKGWAALTFAASDGNLELVKYFVESHANVETRDSHGWTPLMWAAGSGHVEVPQHLAEVGGDVNAVDQSGRTPLMWASIRNLDDVTWYLISNGANANAATAQGETATFFASKHGHQEIQRILMQHLRYDQEHGNEIQNGDDEKPSFAASWFISSFETELFQFVHTGNVGGDYRAKWLDADVVVKLFVPDASATAFVDRVRLWEQLRHPNVIKLYGACDAGHKFFVCEYASRASMAEYLAACDAERRTPWKFLYHASLGLEYLTERSIVHGNLHGGNILIGSEGFAKLADFGSSRPTTADKTVIS